MIAWSTSKKVLRLEVHIGIFPHARSIFKVLGMPQCNDLAYFEQGWLGLVSFIFAKLGNWFGVIVKQLLE